MRIETIEVWRRLNRIRCRDELRRALQREFYRRGWPRAAQRYAQQAGPQEGETKWENGRQYVFHDRRWHRVASPLAASPNVEESLSFEESVRRLQSERHQAMRAKFIQHAQEAVGVPNRVVDVVGDWKDGSENSVLIEWDRPIASDHLRYAAARMGLEAQQKAVVWLSGDPNGDDRYFRCVCRLAPEQAREILAGSGFYAWSLDVSQEG